MGMGEYVGNQSVYWRNTHHDKGGGKKKLKCRVPDVVTKGLPDPDTIHVSDEAFAHDDIPFGDIGKRHRHPGYFRITLRFASNPVAVNELTRALQAVGSTGTEVELFVQAINRTSSNVDPAKPAAEVQVDW